jgi:hypothetical protein
MLSKPKACRFSECTAAQHPLHLTALSCADFEIGFATVPRLTQGGALQSRAAGELFHWAAHVLVQLA